MKTSDSFLNVPQALAAIVGLLMLCSAVAHADAPAPETFNKSSELVLTLSDHWPQSGKQTPFDSQAASEAGTVMANRSHKKPVKVDCAMDINQLPSSDHSFGNRLTGECDLHYNY